MMIVSPGPLDSYAAHGGKLSDVDCSLTTLKPIIANSSKGGDAKPWILSCVLFRSKIARLPKLIPYHVFFRALFLDQARFIYRDSRFFENRPPRYGGGFRNGSKTRVKREKNES